MMMKSITTVFIIFSSFFGVADDYKKTKSELVQAVENRNFVEAETLLNDLMPLMRKDLKEFRGEISSVKSSLSGEEYESLKNSFKQKYQIYKTMQRLAEVSPAAVRARSEEIVEMLDEYQNIAINQ